jgi:membrane fusion protein (multidrug efflux system)
LFVWRIAEGKASKVKVRAGVRRDSQVEIVEGLATGESIVVAGQLKLNRDGQDVRIIDPSKRGGPGAPSPAPSGGAPVPLNSGAPVPSNPGAPVPSNPSAQVPANPSAPVPANPAATAPASK